MKALKGRRSRQGLPALPNGSFPSLDEEYWPSLPEPPSWSSSSRSSFKSPQPSASRPKNLVHQISKLNCILCMESSFGSPPAAMDGSVITVDPNSCGAPAVAAKDAGQDTSTTTEETATFDVVEQEDFVTKLFLMREVPLMSHSNDSEYVNRLVYGEPSDDVKSAPIEPEPAANHADSSSYYETDDDSSETSGLPLESMSTSPDSKVDEEESEEKRIGIRPFQVPFGDGFPSQHGFPFSDPVENIVAIEDALEGSTDETCFIMVDAMDNSYHVRAKEILRASGSSSRPPPPPDREGGAVRDASEVEHSSDSFESAQARSEYDERRGEVDKLNQEESVDSSIFKPSDDSSIFKPSDDKELSTTSEESCETQEVGMEESIEPNVEPKVADDDGHSRALPGASRDCADAGQFQKAPSESGMIPGPVKLDEHERPASPIESANTVVIAGDNQEGEDSVLSPLSHSCLGTAPSNTEILSSSVQVVLRTLERINMERSANNSALRKTRSSPNRPLISSPQTTPCNKTSAAVIAGSDQLQQPSSIPASSFLEGEGSVFHTSSAEHIKQCSSSELKISPSRSSSVPPPPPPPPPLSSLPLTPTNSVPPSPSSAASSKLQSLISKFESTSFYTSPIGPRARKVGVATPPSPAPPPPFASRSVPRKYVHNGQSVRDNLSVRRRVEARRGSKPSRLLSPDRARAVQIPKEETRMRIDSLSPSRSRRLSPPHPVRNGTNDPSLHPFFWRSHPDAKPAYLKSNGSSGKLNAKEELDNGRAHREPVTRLDDYEKKLKKKRDMARREFEAANKPPWAK